MFYIQWKSVRLELLTSIDLYLPFVFTIYCNVMSVSSIQILKKKSGLVQHTSVSHFLKEVTAILFFTCHFFSSEVVCYQITYYLQKTLDDCMLVCVF